eukprot:gb/GECG01005375.1/.p1 GENE.gb/GECG01005375.1/~~gb/GECG01005375.1/.p1  ORF type:complete len:1423 (+),score=135.61 gb/GECG01005375.1/:1-4269(+)
MQRVISCYGNAGVYYNDSKLEHVFDDNAHLIEVNTVTQYQSEQLDGDTLPELRRFEFWIRASQQCSGGYEPQLVLSCRRRPEQTAYQQSRLLGSKVSPLCTEVGVSTFGGPTRRHREWANQCFTEDTGDQVVDHSPQAGPAVRSCWLGLSKSIEPFKVVRYGVEFANPLKDEPVTVQWYLEGSDACQDQRCNPFPGSWQEDLRVWQSLDERNLKTDKVANQCLWFDLPSATAGRYRSYRLHIYCANDPVECVNVSKIYFMKEDVNTSDIVSPQLAGWMLAARSTGCADLSNFEVPVRSYQLTLQTEERKSLLATEAILHYGRWHQVTLDLFHRHNKEEVELAVDGYSHKGRAEALYLASPTHHTSLFKFGIGWHCFAMAFGTAENTCMLPEASFLRLMLHRRSPFGAEWRPFVGDLSAISETHMNQRDADRQWTLLHRVEPPHSDKYNLASLPPLLQQPFLSFDSVKEYMQRFLPLLHSLPRVDDPRQRSSFSKHIRAALVHDCGLTNYKEDAVDATCLDRDEESDSLCRARIAEGNLYIGRNSRLEGLQSAGVNPKGTTGHCFRVEHWSHFDCFIYFSHQRISMPPASWVKAAKVQRGSAMRVLGTIITEHKEGEADTWKILDGFWPTQTGLTSKFEGHQIIRYLAQLARIRGFDGWLVNLEADLPACSSNTEAAVTACHNMLRALTLEVKQWVGEDTGTVLWYDSISKEGIVDWQCCLNDNNATFAEACDGIFCDYHWKNTGCTSPAESLRRLTKRKARCNVLYGTDVWGRGTFGGGRELCKLGMLPPLSNGLSVALFSPAWAYENDDIDCCGALGTMEWEWSQNMLWHGHGASDTKWNVTYSTDGWCIDSPDLRWLRFPLAEDFQGIVDVVWFTPPSTALADYEALVFSEKVNSNATVGYHLFFFQSKQSLEDELLPLPVNDDDTMWPESPSTLIASSSPNSSVARLCVTPEQLSTLSRSERGVAIVRVTHRNATLDAEQANFKLVAKERDALVHSMLPYLNREKAGPSLPFSSICSLPFFTCFCVGCGFQLWRYGVAASDTMISRRDGWVLTETQRSRETKGWINLGVTEPLPSFFRNESSVVRSQGENNSSYGCATHCVGWELGNSWRVTLKCYERDSSVTCRLFVGCIPFATLQKYVSLSLVYQSAHGEDRTESCSIVPRMYVPQLSKTLFPVSRSQSVPFMNDSWEGRVWVFDFHEELGSRECADASLVVEIDLVSSNSTQDLIIGEVGMSSVEKQQPADIRDWTEGFRMPSIDNTFSDVIAVLYRDVPSSACPDCYSLVSRTDVTTVRDCTLVGVDISTLLVIVHFAQAEEILPACHWGITLYWYWTYRENLRGWDIYCEGKWISFVSSNPTVDPELAVVSKSDGSLRSPYYLSWFPAEEDRIFLRHKDKLEFHLIPRYSVASLLSTTFPTEPR